MSALDDRRQRAREAGQDACAMSMPTESESAAIECAIETATRVRVTPEILRAAQRASLIGFETHDAIVAAFRAAGFEVEQ